MESSQDLRAFFLLSLVQIGYAKPIHPVVEQKDVLSHEGNGLDCLIGEISKHREPGIYSLETIQQLYLPQCTGIVPRRMLQNESRPTGILLCERHHMADPIGEIPQRPVSR